MTDKKCDICGNIKGMCFGNCPNHPVVVRLKAEQAATKEPVVEEPKEEKVEKKPKAKKAAKKAKK